MKFKVYFTCLKFHAWDFSKACILYLRDCKTIVMAFVMTLELLHIEKNIIIKRAISKVRK